MDDVDYYWGYESNHTINARDHVWIEQHLTSLDLLTFEMRDATSYGDEECYGHWLRNWWFIFEDMFHCEIPNQPPRFSMHVVSYDERIPTEEWLTEDNYLQVRKLVLHKQAQLAPETDEFMPEQMRRDIMAADDADLGNPAAFFRKISTNLRIHEVDAGKPGTKPVYHTNRDMQKEKTKKKKGEKKGKSSRKNNVPEIQFML